MSIVWIDMHYRDERVLDWIKSQAGNEGARIAAETVADTFRCHANTARAILKRLERAGYVEVDKRSYRGGFFYKVKRETANHTG